MKDVHEEAGLILEKIFSNVNDWLKFAEAKNGIAATMNIALLGALSSYDALYCCNMLFFLIMFCICASVLVCIMSFLPLKSADTQAQTGHNINLIYYKHIAGCHYREYLKEVYLRFCREEVSYSDIPKLNIYYAEEICENAKIAVRKYRLCTIALLFDIAGIALTVAAFFCSCFPA